VRSLVQIQSPRFQEPKRNTKKHREEPGKAPGNGRERVQARPSKGSPDDPQGLEFQTSIDGYPALGVKGDVPPSPTGPVSQLRWWTGEMYFDLYGPLPYGEIEAVAHSIASASPSGTSTDSG
jgi:hypothetical protein